MSRNNSIFSKKNKVAKKGAVFPCGSTCKIIVEAPIEKLLSKSTKPQVSSAPVKLPSTKQKKEQNSATEKNTSAKPLSDDSARVQNFLKLVYKNIEEIKHDYLKLKENAEKKKENVVNKEKSELDKTFEKAKAENCNNNLFPEHTNPKISKIKSISKPQTPTKINKNSPVVDQKMKINKSNKSKNPRLGTKQKQNFDDLSIFTEDLSNNTETFTTKSNKLVNNDKKFKDLKLEPILSDEAFATKINNLGKDKNVLKPKTLTIMNKKRKKLNKMTPENVPVRPKETNVDLLYSNIKQVNKLTQNGEESNYELNAIESIKTSISILKNISTEVNKEPMVVTSAIKKKIENIRSCFLSCSENFIVTKIKQISKRRIVTKRPNVYNKIEDIQKQLSTLKNDDFKYNAKQSLIQKIKNNLKVTSGTYLNRAPIFCINTSIKQSLHELSKLCLPKNINEELLKYESNELLYQTEKKHNNSQVRIIQEKPLKIITAQEETYADSEYLDEIKDSSVKRKYFEKLKELEIILKQVKQITSNYRNNSIETKVLSQGTLSSVSTNTSKKSVKFHSQTRDNEFDHTSRPRSQCRRHNVSTSSFDLSSVASSDEYILNECNRKQTHNTYSQVDPFKTANNSVNSFVIIQPKQKKNQSLELNQNDMIALDKALYKFAYEVKDKPKYSFLVNSRATSETSEDSAPYHETTNVCYNDRNIQKPEMYFPETVIQQSTSVVTLYQKYACRTEYYKSYKPAAGKKSSLENMLLANDTQSESTRSCMHSLKHRQHVSRNHSEFTNISYSPRSEYSSTYSSKLRLSRYVKRTTTTDSHWDSEPYKWNMAQYENWNQVKEHTNTDKVSSSSCNSYSRPKETKPKVLVYLQDKKQPVANQERYFEISTTDVIRETINVILGPQLPLLFPKIAKPIAAEAEVQTQPQKEPKRNLSKKTTKNCANAYGAEKKTIDFKRYYVQEGHSPLLLKKVGMFNNVYMPPVIRCCCCLGQDSKDDIEKQILDIIKEGQRQAMTETDASTTSGTTPNNKNLPFDNDLKSVTISEPSPYALPPYDEDTSDENNLNVINFKDNHNKDQLLDTNRGLMDKKHSFNVPETITEETQLSSPDLDEPIVNNDLKTIRNYNDRTPINTYDDSNYNTQNTSSTACNCAMKSRCAGNCTARIKNYTISNQKNQKKQPIKKEAKLPKLPKQPVIMNNTNRTINDKDNDPNSPNDKSSPGEITSFEPELQNGGFSTPKNSNFGPQLPNDRISPRRNSNYEPESPNGRFSPPRNSSFRPQSPNERNSPGGNSSLKSKSPNDSMSPRGNINPKKCDPACEAMCSISDTSTTINNEDNEPNLANDRISSPGNNSSRKKDNTSSYPSTTPSKTLTERQLFRKRGKLYNNTRPLISSKCRSELEQECKLLEERLGKYRVPSDPYQSLFIQGRNATRAVRLTPLNENQTPITNITPNGKIDVDTLSTPFIVEVIPDENQNNLIIRVTNRDQNTNGTLSISKGTSVLPTPPSILTPLMNNLQTSEVKSQVSLPSIKCSEHLPPMKPFVTPIDKCSKARFSAAYRTLFPAAFKPQKDTEDLVKSYCAMHLRERQAALVSLPRKRRKKCRNYESLFKDYHW